MISLSATELTCVRLIHRAEVEHVDPRFRYRGNPAIQAQRRHRGAQAANGHHTEGPEKVLTRAGRVARRVLSVFVRPGEDGEARNRKFRREKKNRKILTAGARCVFSVRTVS